MKRLAYSIAIALLLVSCNERQEAKKTIPQPQAPSKGLSITSPAFADNGEIPKKYGCSGDSVSPPLVIAGVPANAKSLALTVTDPDAPGGLFTHWVVWNMPPADTTIAEGQSTGAAEGTNSYGKHGYGTLCPPFGAHRYIFNVYALDASLPLDPGAGREDVENAMKGHVVAQARIVGTYRK